MNTNHKAYPYVVLFGLHYLQIPSSVPCCQTPSTYGLSLIWRPYSHLHKTKGKIKILDILISIFLYITREDKSLLQVFPESKEPQFQFLVYSYNRATDHEKSISNEHEYRTKNKTIFVLSALFILSCITGKPLLVRAALSTWKITECSFSYGYNLISCRRLESIALLWNLFWF
jgi:hypothetical protein